MSNHTDCLTKWPHITLYFRTPFYFLRGTISTPNYFIINHLPIYCLPPHIKS